MADTWTTPQQVLDRWLADDPPSHDDPRLPVTIGRAERAIRRVYRDMAARLAATGPDGTPTEPDLPDSIADVVAELVQGAYTNPLGLRQTSTVTGPYTDTETVGGDNPGRIVLSADQTRLLAPPGAGSRLRVIDLAAGSRAALADELPRHWWSW